MKSWNRLLLYILLNVIVSALTVLGVLWIWEITHPTPEVLPSQQSPAQSKSPLATQLSQDQTGADIPVKQTTPLSEETIQVSIEGVFGVGIFDLEYVLIRNNSPVAIDLMDWRLVDDDGNIYTFPALTLNTDGAVKLFSRSGTNPVIELFWSSQQALWASDDQASLLDNTGIIRATYRIP